MLAIFEDNFSSVSDCIYCYPEHVVKCFDRFGRGYNTTRVATWFRTLFPPFSPVYRRTPQRLASFTGRHCADTLGLTAKPLLKERGERDSDSPTTMSVHHRQPTLGRLMIPPNLSLQQPGQTAIFSPSLPTSIQQGFHPPFVGHIPGNVMTPVQAEFMHMPMPTAGRPINHRARASIAQLAAAGVPPPMGVPLTPLLSGQFPQGVPPMLIPTPQFQPRSRRAPSVSTGGPPKAVLGGPGAKNRVTTEAVPTPATIAPPQKTKKVIVNIPRETIPVEGNGEDPDHEAPPRREIWARIPLRPSEVPEIVDPVPPETISVEPFPPENRRTQLPPNVCLSRKVGVI